MSLPFACKLEKRDAAKKADLKLAEHYKKKRSLGREAREQDRLRAAIDGGPGTTPPARA